MKQCSCVTVSALFDITLSLMVCDVAVGFFTGCSWYLNYSQVMGIALEVKGIVVVITFPSRFC